jgi:site-specific recombinase XerC
MTMSGIRRTHRQPQRRVAAAVKADILAMTATLGESLKGHRDRALLLIGFAGALRRSELCAINCADIERVPQGIVITLNRSKTDQSGQGRKIGIPYARGVVCLVHALDGWLSASGISAGPVFRSVTRHGHVGFGRLCDKAVASVVKELERFPVD